MANIKSKEKNIKRIQKATERNRIIKSRVRTSIKKARVGIENKDKNVNTLISNAKKEIQTAVSKGVYHKNNGARKQSRLEAYAVRAK